MSVIETLLSRSRVGLGLHFPDWGIECVCTILTTLPHAPFSMQLQYYSTSLPLRIKAIRLSVYCRWHQGGLIWRCRAHLLKSMQTTAGMHMQRAVCGVCALILKWRTR